MNIKNCSTAIFVKDIKRSKEFYHKILEIPITMNLGGNVILENGVTLWEISKHHIIPASLGMDKVAGISTNRFELYFETDDIYRVYDKLVSKKVRFMHEVREEHWGQQTIRFFDPDNHLIEVGESMNQFVTRFYNQGLTVEQVARRTSVPIEEVKKLLGIQPEQ